jgi:hypothetical protein
MKKKMKNYIVRIQAIVTKDIDVQAVSEAAAIEMAHGMFTVAPEDDVDEKYEQETISVKLIKT